MQMSYYGNTNLESQWRDRIVHNFSHAKSQHQDDQQFAVHGTQRHPKVGANNPKVKIKKLHSRNSERKKTAIYCYIIFFA
jgi:hypothetical protein